MREMVLNQIREFHGVLFAALSALSLRRWALCRALALPVLAVVAFQVFFVSPWNDVERYFLLYLIPMVFYAMIAIRTHRIVLLGEDAIAADRGHSGKRLGWYILFSFVIGLIVGLCMMLSLIPVPFLNWTLAISAAAYFGGRLSLIFPAIALDRRPLLRDAWDASFGHGFLMVLSVVVPVVIFLWIDWLPLDPTPLAFSTMAGEVLQTVLTAALLSKCFQRLFLREGDSIEED